MQRSLLTGLCWATWFGFAAFSPASAQEEDAAPVDPTPGPLGQIARNPFPAASTSSSGSDRVIADGRIFFPPNPPPLGVPIPNRRPIGPGASPSAPTELKRYVTEPFHAPISPEFARGPFRDGEDSGMSDEETLKLQTFDSLTDVLLAELRARLAALANADPTKRRAELESLATTQADRLAEREKLAEELRASFARQHDWNRAREWKLGRGDLKVPRERTRALEFEVIRAAAYFQDGLLPAQRRLLRELAMELGEDLRAKDGDVSAAPYFLSLLPETARVPLPADLPPDLRLLIRQFHDDKGVLKKELADALYESDGTVFASGRTRALHELGQRQATRLAALETHAEELRRTIAARSAFPRTRLSAPLPGDLQTELDAYVGAHVALARARQDFVTRARADTNARSGGTPSGQSREEVMAARQTRAEAAQQRMGELMTEFDNLHAEERAALRAKAEALAPRLAALLDAQTLARMAPQSTPFLSDFLRQRQEQHRTAEYDIAVLEPGLSPEQRRMLFGATINSLSLPQPPGVRFPTKAPGTLLPQE